MTVDSCRSVLEVEHEPLHIEGEERYRKYREINDELSN